MQWSLDPQGAIAHVSPEWTQFTGIADAAVIGSASRPSIHRLDREVVAGIIAAAVEARAAFLAVFRSRRPNDAYTWVLAGATPSFSPADGTLLGYLGDTEPLVATPIPPRAMDVLHRVPHGTDRQVVLLDAIADHVMAARTLARHADDRSVARVLDFTLLAIGDRLHQATR